MMEKNATCQYCNGTGKIKVPNDEKMFEYYIELEMNKGYFADYRAAEEKAFEKVGFTVRECPYCQQKK